MQNLEIAKAKSQDSRVPANGEAGSCQMLPMVGQVSLLLPGNRDMAHKECGCQQGKLLVGMDRLLQEGELHLRLLLLPHTSYPRLQEGFPLPKASHRGTVPLLSSVLAMGLHHLHLINLPLQECLLHLPLLGQRR